MCLMLYINVVRTHARGSIADKLDPEQAAERANKKKRAAETQKCIEKQVNLLRTKCVCGSELGGSVCGSELWW